MIEHDDIGTMLNSITELAGRVRYHVWPEAEAPVPPFAVYDLPSETPFGADDRRYWRSHATEVHLVTKLRDFETEQAVEEKLDANGVYYQKQADFDNEEKVWIITYTFEAL